MQSATFIIKHKSRSVFKHGGKWPVTMVPHYMHPHGSQDVTDSLMTGNPKHDMPCLIEELKKYLLS